MHYVTPPEAQIGTAGDGASDVWLPLARSSSCSRSGVGLFSAIDARYATHQAAQGQLAFAVGEENFSGPGSAIEPTFE